MIDIQYRAIYRVSKRNAAIRKIPFGLLEQVFEGMVRRANGKCELTGIPFSFCREAGVRRNPWAPSLDRIDSRKGYTWSNCRLVCVAVNLAMNEWGEEVLFKLAKAISRRSVVSIEPLVEGLARLTQAAAICGVSVAHFRLAKRNIPGRQWAIGSGSREPVERWDVAILRSWLESEEGRLFVLEAVA